jgi:hypothetical protein
VLAIITAVLTPLTVALGALFGYLTGSGRRIKRMEELHALIEKLDQSTFGLSRLQLAFLFESEKFLQEVYESGIRRLAMLRAGIGILAAAAGIVGVFVTLQSDVGLVRNYFSIALAIEVLAGGWLFVNGLLKLAAGVDDMAIQSVRDWMTTEMEALRKSDPDTGVTDPGFEN